MVCVTDVIAHLTPKSLALWKSSIVGSRKYIRCKIVSNPLLRNVKKPKLNTHCFASVSEKMTSSDVV